MYSTKGHSEIDLIKSQQFILRFEGVIAFSYLSAIAYF